jgi:hypothetical protein
MTLEAMLVDPSIIPEDCRRAWRSVIRTVFYEAKLTLSHGTNH